jgi:integrase
MKLTERTAKTASPKAKTYILRDPEVPGFGLRITPAGAKAFVLDYRLKGKRHLKTIGRFGNWTTQGARQYARELRVMIDKGVSPEEDTEAKTVRDAWDRYERNRLPNTTPKTQKTWTIYWRQRIAPAMGSKLLKDVTYNDCEALFLVYSKTSPFAANRCLTLLKALFNQAIRWGWCERNPVVGIELNHEQPKQDYLTPDEAKALIAALETRPRNGHQADALLFLLYTGARKLEVLQATWDQFREPGIWRKPSSSMKSGREHRVPLSPQAQAIIARREHTADRVFVHDNGQRLGKIENTLKQACRDAGIEPRRNHALRHSFASLAASAGLSLPVIGALLDHSTPAVTNRYASLMDSALKDAVERVGKAVS